MRARSASSARRLWRSTRPTIAGLLPSRRVRRATRTVRADDREASGGIVEIAGRGFQMIRRLLPRLFVQHVGCADRHRRTADEQRARADRAHALREIGVALHDPHLLDRYVEGGRHHLRVAGLQPLPHRLRCRMHGHAAVGIDEHARRLLAYCRPSIRCSWRSRARRAGPSLPPRSCAPKIRPSRRPPTRGRSALRIRLNRRPAPPRS